MSTELSLAALDDLDNLVNSYLQTMPSSGGSVGGFARMDKVGRSIHGAEGTPLDPEGIWLIHPKSLGRGWIAWKNGKPENEVYKLLDQPLPPMSALPPVTADDGWQEQRGFVLVCIAGKEKGEQLNFKSNSKGGIDAVQAVTTAIGGAIREAKLSGSRAICPKVKLASSSYQHSEYGKIYKPVFEIVGWSVNDPSAEVAPEPDPQPKPDQGVADRAVTGRRRRSVGA